MTITNNTNIWDLPNEMHFQIIQLLTVGTDSIEEDMKNLNQLGATCRHFHSIISDFIPKFVKNKLQYWNTQMQLIAPTVCDRMIQFHTDEIPTFLHTSHHITKKHHYGLIKVLAFAYKRFRELRLDSDTTHSEQKVKLHSNNCICLRVYEQIKAINALV